MPDSRCKTMLWDLVIALLLIITALYYPFRFAFWDNVDFGYIITEYVIDIIFVIDIILNFFTAFYNNNYELISDKKKIAKHYLKWFFFDLIAW